MKKKIFILAAVLFTTMAASATILFTSSCGRQTYTVGFEFFDSIEEAIDTYMDLDDALCGNN